MLPRHARCVLSRLHCNGHSLLLGSYLSRIGKIENPSCSACGHSSQDISHLILHCPTTDTFFAAPSLATLCFSTTSGPNPWELPGFWGSMVFHHAPIPRKGSGNNNNSNVTMGITTSSSICSGNESISRHLATPQTQRNSPSRVTALPDQLDDFNDHDKISDFSSIGKCLFPSGYKLQIDKSIAVFCKLENCKTFDIPTVTEAIVIDNDLHVKLLFSGSPVFLPKWFVKGKDCRLKKVLSGKLSTVYQKFFRKQSQKYHA